MKRTSRPENLCRRKHRRKISSGSRGRACASSSVSPFLFAPLMRLIRNFISRKKPCLWGSASYNIKLPCTVIFPLFATLLYVCTCIEVRVFRMAARMVGSYVLPPPVEIYFRRKFRATENSIRAVASRSFWIFANVLSGRLILWTVLQKLSFSYPQIILIYASRFCSFYNARESLRRILFSIVRVTRKLNSFDSVFEGEAKFKFGKKIFARRCQ